MENNHVAAKLPEMSVILAFFFRGMSKAWAGGGEYIPMPSMPRHKYFDYFDGEFMLKDWYFTVPGSRKSGGGTMMWFAGVPFWQMSYGGWYAEEAIPIVKEALRTAYANKLFNAGRGPASYDKDDLVYHNFCSTRGETAFTAFDGHERVMSTTKCECLGQHDFWGRIYI